MSTTRTSLPLTVLVVLLVAIATAIFSSSTPDDGLEDPTLPAPANGESPSTATAPTPPRLDPDASTFAADPLAIDRDTVAAAGESTHSDRDHDPRIEGSVVVVDGQRVENEGPSGTIDAIVVDASGARGPRIQIPVQIGRFSISVPLGTPRLHFVDATLDSQPAYCEIDSLELDGSPIALRFRHRGRTIVRVRDEVSGVDLSDVTLVTDGAIQSTDRLEHPGFPLPDNALARNARSPIDITDRLGDGYRRTIYATAPGYAWGSVVVNVREGGTLPILLVRGGRLVVRTRGAPPPKTGWLRLRLVGETRPRGQVKFDGRDSFEFDGLRPGEYRISVDTSPWWSDSNPLVTGTVALNAGATEVVDLEIPPQPAIADVPFQGVVFLPRAWKRRDFTLAVEPVDRSRPRLVVGDSKIEPFPDDPESFRFDAGHIAPGRYGIQVDPYQWVLLHEVGPTGDLGCRIEIPPPTHVSVRALDALTGEPAKIEGITWSVRRPEEITSGSLENVGRDPKSGHFEFDCVTAPIELQIWEDGYSFLNETHALVPGTNEITVHLTPSCGIDLTLRCDGRTVLFPRGFDFELVPISGTGETVAASYNDERQRRVVDVPGRYRVTIPAIQGYLPVEPFELDIAPGKFVEHVIELRARP